MKSYEDPNITPDTRLSVNPKAPIPKEDIMAKTPTAPSKKEEKPSAGLVKRENTKVSTQMQNLLMEDAGAGSENIGREDVAIPRIVILQSGSPQVNKRDAAYVEGASAGDFFNTLDNSVFDGAEGVLFVPCAYRRAFIEWKPRTDGGGFVRDHGSNPAILDQCHKDDASGKDILPNGNEVVTTAEYIGFLINEESGIPQQVVISMTSTQLKKARRWNTMIQQLLIPKPQGIGVFNPAMFYKAYKLTTVPEGNDKGNWFGWEITPDVETLSLNNGEQIYLSARAFKKAINEGKVQVAQDTQQHHIDGEADSM